MSSTRIAPPYPTFEDVDGDGNVNFQNDDITDRNKQVLRSYLSDLTLGRNPDESDAVIEYNGQLPPNHANPYPLTPIESPQPVYTDQVGLQEAVDLSNQPSELFGDTNRIVHTGPLGEASSEAAGTGHEFLPGVIGSELRDGPVRTSNPEAKRYVETLGSSLKKKNLYVGTLKVSDADGNNPISVVESNEFSGENIRDVSSSQRVNLGNTLEGTLSHSFDAADAKFIKEANLKKVAVQLMEAAMGNKEVQAGKKRIKNSNSNIRAANSTGFEKFNRTTLGLGQDAIDSGESDNGSNYTDVSWGNYFSPNKQYTGSETAKGAFLLTANFLAIILAVAAVIGVFALKSENKDRVPTEIDYKDQTALYRKLAMGEFKFQPINGFAIGLTTVLKVASSITGLDINNPIYRPTNPTVNYGDCVVAGFASFLGVSYVIDLKLIKSALGGLFILNFNTFIILAEIVVRYATLLIDNPQRQYYMNIFRLLQRDRVHLSHLKDNVGDDEKIGDKIEAGAEFISELFDSKLFKFVNTLAKIGDLEYTQAIARKFRATDVEVSPGVAYSEGFDYSKDDSKGLQTFLAKGFASLRVSSNKLAERRGVTWGIADLPSLHLIPGGSGQIYKDLIGDSSYARKRLTSTEPGGKNRFTPEQVSAIEDVLDAEYMPFYFQDLRTNEIVAFHAFLDDLSDSYSANFNKTSGYGRVDDVQTYKDTKRSVGITFHLVGTNPSDFDYMWWQINKLTTMVYPQWSQGRKMQTSDRLSFLQPFSQVITGSPIVRVRLGDVIRSNYSRFNLKRLFGWQDAELKQSDDTTAIEYYLPVGAILSLYPDGSGDHVKLTEEYSLGFKKPKIFKEGSFQVLYSDPDNPGYSQLKFAQSVLIRQRNTKSISQIANDFYKYENNTIIKSFEDSHGKGLAAAVTQLNFTWGVADHPWGTGGDGPGNRAPRYCKVQMNFDPIHDIAPGIDSDGFNRAPIYPVGDIVNSIVEGGEDQPYGVGTFSNSVSDASNKKSQIVYNIANEPGYFKKFSL
jgi:hypothetical protein